MKLAPLQCTPFNSPRPAGALQLPALESSGMAKWVAIFKQTKGSGHGIIVRTRTDASDSTSFPFA